MGSFLEIFDIYLLEAMVNGILLGGVLALLALGLNLCRKTMGVPAKAALNAIALHGFEPWD